MLRSKRATVSSWTRASLHSIALVNVIFLSSAAAAQDWPQWRGAARDGHLTSFAAPASWPQALEKVWSVEVGTGYASPVVAGGRVYLFSRRGDDEVVSAFELQTGRALWREAYPAPYRLNPAATSHGMGPKSTPVLADGKLYTLGISGILSGWEGATGRRLWHKDFTGELKETTPLYGVAMSAVVEGDLLIAHVGGHGQGALMAFDRATGSVRWSWTGDGPGYASPVVVELGGTRQVVTQSQDHLVGVAAADGKLLWSVPFTTSYTQNCVTPVVYQDMLIFSGLDKGVVAIRPMKRGDAWAAEKVWEAGAVSLYMSSPVRVGDLLFGLSHRNKGQFFCLDLAKGTVLWTSEGRQGENAALVAAGDLLFFLTNDAELLVVRATGKSFDVLKRYEVAQSPTWAHPAIVGNRVLVKDQTSLTLWTIP